MIRYNPMVGYTGFFDCGNRRLSLPEEEKPRNFCAKKCARNRKTESEVDERGL